jgi:hypothetical protein
LVIEQADNDEAWEKPIIVKSQQIQCFSFLIMCRNIKPLYNFEPATTDEEIRAAAIQFVRKVSGFNKPSAANSEAFETAVAEITAASKALLESLNTSAPPKNRDVERERAKERNKIRFGAAKNV